MTDQTKGPIISQPTPLMGPPENKRPKRCPVVNPDKNFPLLGQEEGKEDALEANSDKIFDPCAEMLIHDFDDEQTLEEEEALETYEDPQVELSNLQKEGDMPLDELLALYGYNEDEPKPEKPEEVAEKSDSGSLIGAKEEEAEITSGSHDSVEEQEEPSKLVELYPEQMPTTKSNRLLRSGSRPQSEEEEEEDEDGDYNPVEANWKKTIMVGSDYQAKIPVGLLKYDDVLPYENDDKMLWDPSSLSESKIVEFLAKAQNTTNADSTPQQPKDDEQALYLLLQCGYNVDEALRRRRISCVPAGDSVSIWSEDECRNFETGIRLHGKNFFDIQKTKVRTRSVGELVQFYYLWKKTERYDVYARKSCLEKKKFTLHPGITDFMDRFLNEQEVGCNNIPINSDKKNAIEDTRSNGQPSNS